MWNLSISLPIFEVFIKYVWLIFFNLKSKMAAIFHRLSCTKYMIFFVCQLQMHDGWTEFGQWPNFMIIDVEIAIFNYCWARNVITNPHAREYELRPRDDNNNVTDSNVFHMEPGRTLFMTMRVCNDAMLCTNKSLGSITMTDKKAVLETIFNYCWARNVITNPHAREYVIIVLRCSNTHIYKMKLKVTELL
jgi:hypothetical protein